MGLIIHIDGGARGNPGPAGAGVVIRTEEGPLVHEAGYFLGRQTNNAAEYYALIRALERAVRCDPQPLAIHSDSELIVRQLTGEYQVKSPGLAALHRQAQILLLKVNHWTVRHVPRDENRRADELANLAMDQRRSIIVFDTDGVPPGDAAVAAEAGIQPQWLPPGALDEGPESEAAAQQAATREASDEPTPRPGGDHTVRVTLTRPPAAGGCPGGCLGGVTAVTIGLQMPPGVCLHAAHALLPTALAILNADPEEFAAVPTLTVRCSQPGCGAEFQLSPSRSPNGRSPRRED